MSIGACAALVESHWAGFESVDHPLSGDSPRSGRGRHPLRRAIATRRGYSDWTVDHAGWVVLLLSPEEQSYFGSTLEEALAWCLVWLMAPELGVGPFLV